MDAAVYHEIVHEKEAILADQKSVGLWKLPADFLKEDDKLLRFFRFRVCQQKNICDCLVGLQPGMRACLQICRDHLAPNRIQQMIVQFGFFAAHLWGLDSSQCD